MKNKVAAGAICVLTLFLMSLFLTSKISDAYTTAITEGFSHPAIKQQYGRYQTSVLIGSQYKLGPEWSCASLLFVLNGEQGIRVVEVSLLRKKLRDPWKVLEVTIGYFTEPTVVCGPMD